MVSVTTLLSSHHLLLLSSYLSLFLPPTHFPLSLHLPFSHLPSSTDDQAIVIGLIGTNFLVEEGGSQPVCVGVTAGSTAGRTFSISIFTEDGEARCKLYLIKDLMFLLIIAVCSLHSIYSCCRLSASSMHSFLTHI